MNEQVNELRQRRRSIFSTFQNIYRHFDKEGGGCKYWRRRRATVETETWIASAT